MSADRRIEWQCDRCGQTERTDLDVTPLFWAKVYVHIPLPPTVNGPNQVREYGWDLCQQCWYVADELIRHPEASVADLRAIRLGEPT